MDNKNFIKLATQNGTCSVVISASPELEQGFLNELSTYTEFSTIQDLTTVNTPVAVLKLNSTNFEVIATQLLINHSQDHALICLIQLPDYNQLEEIPVFNEFNIIFSPILRI